MSASSLNQHKGVFRVLMARRRDGTTILVFVFTRLSVTFYYNNAIVYTLTIQLHKCNTQKEAVKTNV